MGLRTGFVFEWLQGQGQGERERESSTLYIYILTYTYIYMYILACLGCNDVTPNSPE